MDNPFIFDAGDVQGQYLTVQCSLNKALLKKLPLYGIDDSIEGKTFNEIFSTSLFVQKMKEIALQYNIDISDYNDNNLPLFVEKALVSENVVLRQYATKLAVIFGNRLGLLLLSLKLGEKQNRDARPDWDDRHWQYWHELKNIILVGGLSSGMLGKKLKEQIQYVFDVAHVKPYNIILFDNGTYVAVMGCAQRLLDDDVTALVVDLGHTNIKRSVVSKGKGEISSFTPLESIKSAYVEYGYNLDKGELWHKALDLHKYIVKIISDTYKKQSEKFCLCDNILVSIANYVAAGEINPERGGYAKLHKLGTNYAKILSEDLSGELHKSVKVRLVHDGTANALYFSDIDNAVCISLGTAFGVGFPDIRL